MLPEQNVRRTDSGIPMHLQRLATIDASVPSTQSTRIVSVDLLRGLVMMLMALDHTREYFSELPFSPEDLSKTFGTLFFTRIITHVCAPVFFLLAGAGAYLAVARGKSLPQASRFFWTRGLWLVFLELTVLRFAWNFTFASVGLVQVIWALGWSMVAMALIVKLPIRWIAALGVVTIVSHNLLDAIHPASLGSFSGLWMVLHSPGLVSITPGMSFFVGYPLIPWIGVMAAGYAMGALLDRNERRKWILGLGVALTLAFFVLRAINLYGNGKASSSFFLPSTVGPWKVQPSLTLTIIAFFDTLKYPAFSGLSANDPWPCTDCSGVSGWRGRRARARADPPRVRARTLVLLRTPHSSDSRSGNFCGHVIP